MVLSALEAIPSSDTVFVSPGCHILFIKYITSDIKQEKLKKNSNNRIKLS